MIDPSKGTPSVYFGGIAEASTGLWGVLVWDTT